MTVLEICVDSPGGLATAIAAGADRIELCSALDLGGLTPTPGLIALAARSPVPVYAMIRPRAGDFVPRGDEMEAMRAEIRAVRAAGLAGIVIGASRPDNALDEAALRDLAGEAGGLGITLHRVFDLVPDRVAALELAVELGFERILTSGGALTAPEGAGALAELVEAAGSRIAIMAGSCIRAETVGPLLARTRLREVHASCRTRPAVPSDPALVRFGFVAGNAAETDGAAIAALRKALEQATLG